MLFCFFFIMARLQKFIVTPIEPLENPPTYVIIGPDQTNVWQTANKILIKWEEEKGVKCLTHWYNKNTICTLMLLCKCRWTHCAAICTHVNADACTVKGRFNVFKLTESWKCWACSRTPASKPGQWKQFSEATPFARNFLQDSTVCLGLSALFSELHVGKK